ncbi:MAG: AAA family ATPase [Peptostreptococcaceae bacterium]|nr:AAA family ATPase [Peptostreptococcaceae bacterium]
MKSNKALKPSGVYVRSGTTSAPASEDAIRSMMKTADGDSFEKNRSLIQDLTFNRLEEELQLRGLNFTEVQMKTLGILSPDDIYTNMGLLVSDQCKHSIKIAIFQGDDKSIFKDRKELEGSLFDQLNEAYKTIDFYNGTKATFENLIRKDQRDYPQDAIREALLNAIVHRDYSFSGSTIINIYSKQIEFISLGGLVSGLSLEAAMLGASQPRNEKLANLFYRMKLIEAYGTGISKIISFYEEMSIKPEFKNVKGAFRVVLPNTNTNKVEISNEKYMQVIKLLEKQNEITRINVEKVLKIATTTALNILKEMVNEGLIKKIGSGISTMYIIK